MLALIVACFVTHSRHGGNGGNIGDDVADGVPPEYNWEGIMLVIPKYLSKP